MNARSRLALLEERLTAANFARMTDAELEAAWDALVADILRPFGGDVGAFDRWLAARPRLLSEEQAKAVRVELARGKGDRHGESESAAP